MKKFISKVKKATKDFFTNKSAFSLVELIVVIAIMAVMAAVLAPALLGYVEKSRAQKDDSAMGEVTNAIQLSLADQNVYDELLPYAVKGNFSCYCDGDTSTNADANKIITKAPDYWLFTDEARKLDETAYFPAGSMRGATVTFKPNGSAEYILKAGVVNQIGDESTKKGTNGGAILEDCPELYNRLRSTVGDTIKVSSQTYRNSTYTIFISMGTTGGNQADKQDAIQVYGQYNGTNLPEVMTATGSATQDKGNAGSGGSEQPGGGGAPTLAAELTTLTPITFKGLEGMELWGGFWTDGTSFYYSYDNQQYILNGDTWEPKTWNGLTNFSGKSVFSYGGNTYCYGYNYNDRTWILYVLNNDTWQPKSCKVLSNVFQPHYLWTDGTNIYHSTKAAFGKPTSHYKFNGDTWEKIVWNGFNDFSGMHVWFDGNNVYYSCSDQQYVLREDTWEKIVWNGFTPEFGQNVWTDGTNVYYGSSNILKNNIWEPKNWNGGAPSSDGIFTDGTNYYYNNIMDLYILS